jgi:hypothetical protein
MEARTTERGVWTHCAHTYDERRQRIGAGVNERSRETVGARMLRVNAMSHDIGGEAGTEAYFPAAGRGALWAAAVHPFVRGDRAVARPETCSAGGRLLEDGRTKAIKSDGPGRGHLRHGARCRS